MPTVLETMMLICFGFSWPVSLIKSLRSKTAASTSLPFILLITSGYLFGIGAKLFSGGAGYVLAVYFINLVFVLFNLVVYCRNRRLDQKADCAKEETTMPVISVTGNETILQQVRRFETLNTISSPDAVVFFGSGSFSQLPVEEYGLSGQFDAPLYNRSIERMTIDEACVYADRCLAGLHPVKIILGFGEAFDERDTDVSLFLKKYEWLLYSIHQSTDAEILLTLTPETDNAKVRSGLQTLATEYGYACLELYGNVRTPEGQTAILHQLRPYLRTHRISFSEAMRM